MTSTTQLQEAEKPSFERGDWPLGEGDVLPAKVLSLAADKATLRVGELGEATVARADLGDGVKEGAEVQVFVERYDAKDNTLVVSKDKADKLQFFALLESKAAEQGVVQGEIVAEQKGGLAVDIGMKAFLPASQVELFHTDDLRPFIGQKHDFKIIRFDTKRGNVVLSRRVILEEARAVQRAATLKTLAESDVVQGTVKSFVQYGAFIDVGGLDGLLHLTDMSWARVTHPSQVVQVGDSVRVKVLKLERDKGRVSLGLKQLSEDPWRAVPDKYPVGKKVRGTVVSLADFGVFVELENAVQGLVHISELGWQKKKPSDVAKVGDVLETMVLELDPKERRIGLGLKQLLPNPWQAYASKHAKGSKVSGPVQSVVEFGVFVRLEEGLDGLVHASDMSWTERVRPSDKFKKGDVVEAMLLGVDIQGERISLGIKQLSDDPWAAILDKHPAGSKLVGKVTRVVDFGAFVEIAPGIEGLCHVTELTEDRDQRAADIVKAGDDLEVQVLDIDLRDRRIALSVRALTEGQSNYRDFMKDNAAETGFGSALSDKLKQKLEKSTKG